MEALQRREPLALALQRGDYVWIQVNTRVNSDVPWSAESLQSYHERMVPELIEVTLPWAETLSLGGGHGAAALILDEDLRVVWRGDYRSVEPGETPGPEPAELADVLAGLLR